jgi:HK97 family phage portal protein
MALPLRNLIGRIFARRETGEPRYPSTSRIGWTGRTVAGVTITPDNAVTVAAVWACLRYLSQTVAVSPWRVMKEGDRGGVTAKTHAVDWLISKRPNPEWSSFQFRETLTHWALRWGNGYAEIERDSHRAPARALAAPSGARRPAPRPERAQPGRPAGKLYYRVNNGTASDIASTGGGGWVELEAEDVFHIRGFGEGPVGVNVMHYAAESIGWAKAAQLFGAAFLGNGMNVAAVIESDKAIAEPVMARVKAAMTMLYRGVRNAGKTLFLDVGMKFKAVQIDPEKGQFIATNQHLMEEICRWFGVPPHKIAHLLRATFSNIESQSIEVVVDSIVPWVKRFEDEADCKLFGANRQGFYTKMNLNALMRGDSAARAAYYKVMREMGVYSANRILNLEDENEIGADGDKLIVPLNMTTLEKIGEEPLAPANRPSRATPKMRRRQRR